MVICFFMHDAKIKNRNDGQHDTPIDIFSFKHGRVVQLFCDDEPIMMKRGDDVVDDDDEDEAG